MRKSKIFIVVLSFAILFFSFSFAVHAKNAVYILKNTNFAEQKLIDELESIGFAVDKVDNDDIDDVNFSNYDFMLIHDQVFSNAEDIPVNEFPALILNSKHMDEWHWISKNKISQKSSSRPLTAHINDDAHFITKGFPEEVQIYTSSTPSVTYLHRFYRAPKLESVVSVDNLILLNKLNAIIATAEPGTNLKNGFTSNTKSVFFGILEVDFWTTEAENLFKNSALWLVTDFIPPAVSNLTVANKTNSSATITWSTNKEANSTVFYSEDLGFSSSKSSNESKLKHAVKLEGLKEKTTYNYKVEVCNEGGICNTTNVKSFTTLDLTAPYLLSSSIVNLTNKSALISAETNELSNTKLFYSNIPENLNQATSESSLKTNHFLFINNLNEQTTYYYKANTCDNASNCRNSSLFNFTTLDLTKPKGPQNLRLEVVNENNSVKIKWDAAADDAEKYNVYVSNEHDGFNFNVPNSSVFANEYTDTEAALHKKRFYVVRAEDEAGNEEKNGNVVGKHDLELKTRHNLVSLPLLPISEDVDDVMHQDSAYKPVSEIKRFNSAKQEFEVIVFNSNQWTGSFDKLQHGEGYFFRSSFEANFTVVGKLPEEPDLEVKKGMNLLGLTSLETKLISEAINQTDFNVKEIGKRNNDGTYTLATYNGSEWLNEFQLEPGKGYWLKSSKNFTLTIE